MDLVSQIDGRLRALEFMLATAFADAALRSPDIGVALKGATDYIDAKVRGLIPEACAAEAAKEGTGVPIAAFADALLEIKKLMVHITAAGAVRTDQPAN